jgi:branched-chain amino acid transport system permease protein
MKYVPASAALLAGTAWFAYGLGDKVVMNMLVLVLLYAYWGVSWNLAAGHAGLVSLGHALFAGIGAYSVAYLYSAHGWTPWAGVLVGVLLAGMAAAAIGALSFRFGIRGHHFGLLTLACAEIAHLSVGSSLALGRSDGLTMDFTQWGWGYLQFREKWQYALIGAVLLGSALVLTRVLLTRRLGYYMRAVRDNEEAAESLGVPAFRSKMITIVLSACMTAVGGGFYALFISFVDPRSVLSVELSIQILVFCIVGGIGTLWGPVLGAALLVPVGEFIRLAAGTNLPGASAIVYALVLIVIALMLPQGLAGTRWTRRPRRARAGRGAATRGTGAVAP